MVECVAKLALLEWNSQVVKFPCHPDSTVFIDIQAGVGQPLLVKQCIWALRALYDFYEFKEKHFAETNLRIINDGQLLGVGSMYLGPGPSVQDRIPELADSTPPPADVITQDPDLGTVIDVAVPKERINIKWYFYAPKDPICNVGMWHRLVVGLLTIMAEKSASSKEEGDVGYYPPSDITILAAPSNVGQQETGELTVGRAITNLVLVSKTFAAYTPIRDRFRAGHTKISLNGVNIMRTSFFKGRDVPPNQWDEVSYSSEPQTAKLRRRRSG